MIRSLLIANRGEIARRVIRACRKLGVRAIAAYSDADAEALHVKEADEAIRIGPAPARESYLSIDAIVSAAKQAGAEAVHPGYGFLSENADFAQACIAARLIFIGPSPEAIRAMGEKDRAKAIVAKAGVPVLPGGGEDEAQRIGYPLLIKPVAGGGGRGLRVVRGADELKAACDAARREAEAAFGDGRLMLEKFLGRPRHVEVQVLADAHGTVLHLYERDCSIQRRHQKVIEESPAPHLDPDVRHRMHAAAVAAARAVDYVGAGTVEFLMSGDDFFFAEMNTRLQVEHPVTEMVTGIDLVEWQIRIASGEPLSLAQNDVAVTGHAIEARICAEDPERNFLPATGRLDEVRFPAASDRVRVDAGVHTGEVITSHYDSMIAKLIVSGTDRGEAIRRLQTALSDTDVRGVATNLPLLAAIARSPEFASAELDTGFLERLARPPGDTTPDPWHALYGWRLNAAPVRDTWLRPQAEAPRVAAATPGSLASATPGVVKAVLVKPGQKVARDTPLLVIESMKLEVPLTAPADGTVEEVLVAVGEQVEEGRTLVSFKEAA